MTKGFYEAANTSVKQEMVKCWARLSSKLKPRLKRLYLGYVYNSGSLIWEWNTASVADNMSTQA